MNSKSIAESIYEQGVLWEQVASSSPFQVRIVVGKVLEACRDIQISIPLLDKRTSLTDG